MNNKIYQTVSFLFIIFMLWGCPILDPCVTSGGISKEIPDIITISPLQDEYNVNDEIIINFSFSSVQDFYNETIDIYQKTHIDSQALHVSELYKIIENNDYTVLEGGYENYKPSVQYFPSENEYRFKIKVTLNQPGDYSLFAFAEIVFKDPDDHCVSYMIETNIEGMNDDNNIEFTVQE
jgi:hypothetical protein